MPASFVAGQEYGMMAKLEPHNCNDCGGDSFYTDFTDNDVEIKHCFNCGKVYIPPWSRGKSCQN